MGLANIIRSGVAVADRLTADLQVDVTHRTVGAADGDGKPATGSTTTRSAIVTYETKPVKMLDGREALSQAQVVFLSDVAVAMEDVLTLPGGVTGPILKVSRPADSAGTGGFLTQVWLG
ncbi:MAG: hypothetical protein Q8T13_04930 [Acidobacteriota bacterium]|nr:hypothetical protein [Acidobacteriota bacterium]